MLWLRHRILALLGAMVALLTASSAWGSQCGAPTRVLLPGDSVDASTELEVMVVPTSPLPATFDATIPTEIVREVVEDEGCGLEIEGDDVPMCGDDAASEVAPRPIRPTSDAAITAVPCDFLTDAGHLASVTDNDDERSDPPTTPAASHAVLPTLPALSPRLALALVPTRLASSRPRAGVGWRVDRPPRR